MARQARNRRRRSSAEQGFAISLVFVAVFLMAMLGMAVAYSTHQGSQTGKQGDDAVLAMTLISQARTIREGIHLMAARGTDIDAISLDTAGGTASSTGYSILNTGLYHPTLGAAERQQAPARALDAGAAGGPYNWKLVVTATGKGAVKLPGVGLDANDDRVVAIGPVQSGVCRQINRLLWGTATVNKLTAPNTATINLASWMSRPAAGVLDLLGDTNVANARSPDQCVTNKSDNYNVFFFTVRER